ncbi:UDP-N-acetylmuramoyl-L-alanine--D-glutamate ligase [Rivibacter subsaxonicus]|uniref:UDP-N-acetylmuramoylalanine--D-glutamate ligase n=1 Tax=Rivibacter subsaxonicus TaxID=457575 RepID=A0A4V6MEI5_9BURK|nr:UDP-N-acetylmuramoyl-L-alanine--D-glutamate ligase [Rivibacter subsaxonicus]RZT94945.1 UDP-N-acetylmuramoylalanine--D-glutamate ligase [Rivibacter subsaxonicus]
MKQLLDQRVLVLGLGESGLAMARWAARCGAASIVVADSRAQPPKLEALRAELPQAAFVHGFDAQALLGPEDARAIDRVLKSPGLSPLDAAIAPLLAAAEERVIPIYGELDLFAQALAELKAGRGYAPKVLAITGTNGKTTTTMLCGTLVERSGARVAIAGNVGPTMLDTLGAALDLEPAPGEVAAPAGRDESESALTEAAPASAVVEPAAAGEVALVEGEDPTAPVEADDAADADERLEDAPADDLSTIGGGPPAHLIPPPPAGPVFEHLPEVWVLELSSFQLDGVRLGGEGGFAPSAGTVLNLTQDHLDWHGSMAAYGAAKKRVFGADEAWDSVMVVNRDEAAVEAMVPPPLVQKATQRGARSKTLNRKVLRFGLDAPRRPGDFGLIVENGMAWLVRALEADETVKRKRDEEEEIHLQRLMPADALRIRGRHNASNALAALALASAAGIAMAPMLHGLREYRGEPHRVQVLGAVGGVEAVDDSKGTNVGATVAAIEGLGADKAPGKLLVILGGDGKGQDFAPLAAPVARHARALALIGRDAETIGAALAASGVPAQRHDSLEAATRWCFEQAREGDAVLLSPACASLDMFRNYAHRAEVFTATVRELALDRGEELAG